VTRPCASGFDRSRSACGDRRGSSSPSVTPVCTCARRNLPGQAGRFVRGCLAQAEVFWARPDPQFSGRPFSFQRFRAEPSARSIRFVAGMSQHLVFLPRHFASVFPIPDRARRQVPQPPPPGRSGLGAWGNRRSLWLGRSFSPCNSCASLHTPLALAARATTICTANSIRKLPGEKILS
jgi:hypothetical protein